MPEIKPKNSSKVTKKQQKIKSKNNKMNTKRAANQPNKKSKKCPTPIASKKTKIWRLQNRI